MEVYDNNSHPASVEEADSHQLVQSFYTRHHTDLTRLFDMVGLPAEASASLEAAVEHTQPWVKGDHSRPEHRLTINPAYDSDMHKMYAGFGQVGEVMLPVGNYHEIIIPGAVQRGNRRRVGLLWRAVEESGVTTGRITLMGGQRRLFPEVEKDDIEATLVAIDNHGVQDDWVGAIRNNSVDKLWETDGLRLAALEQLGSVALRRIDLRHDEQPNLIDTDPLAGYEFDWQGVPVSLMHTLAVARPNGKPRHTTEACVEDWLQRRQLPQNARIGFIGANPHLERMGRATMSVLQAAGRGDLDLVVAGSAAPPGLGHAHYLGEIARNLYEDLQLGDRHAIVSG